jgi:hypothetical protein
MKYIKSNIFGNMGTLVVNWKVMTRTKNTILRKIGILNGIKTPISRKVAKLAHDWMERSITTNRRTKELRANNERVVRAS